MAQCPIEYDETANRKRIAEIRERGVEAWSSDRVFIGADVSLERIASGSVLMNGVLTGKTLSIGSGCIIGRSGTAVIQDCQVGNGVEVGAGTYSDCVLMDRVRVRGAAEIRGGTILEEDVELGHCVGLKNSILTGFVIAGSCINLCDVIVSGGISRQDHSEIGSGAMNFNFSPNRDKFASLLGDVSGVLFHSPRIFLGGNAGLVAPCEIDFGALIPAGAVVRQQKSPKQKLLSGVRMLANLTVLLAWYQKVRLAGNRSDHYLMEGAVRQVQHNIEWRQAELRRFCDRLKIDIAIGDCADNARMLFLSAEARSFLTRYEKLRLSLDHVAAIRALDVNVTSVMRTVIQQSIEELIESGAIARMP